MTLYGVISSISQKQKLGVSRARCSDSTNLMLCEELVNNG